MIEEEYCTLETSKLLKEAGFPQVRKLFDGNIEIQKRMAKLTPETAKKDFCATEYHYRIDGTAGVLKSRFDPNTCYAMPSQSVAMRWLREENAIFIHIYTHDEYANGTPMYGYQVVRLISNMDRDYIVQYLDHTESALVSDPEAEAIGDPNANPYEYLYGEYEAAAEAGIQAACRYIIDHIADASKMI